MTDSRQRRTEVVKEGKEDCGVAQTREEDVGRKSSPEGEALKQALVGAIHRGNRCHAPSIQRVCSYIEL